VRYWWVNQNQTYRQEIKGGYPNHVSSSPMGTCWRERPLNRVTGPTISSNPKRNICEIGRSNGDIVGWSSVTPGLSLALIENASVRDPLHPNSLPRGVSDQG
jgi:hypothetical protein